MSKVEDVCSPGAGVWIGAETRKTLKFTGQRTHWSLDLVRDLDLQSKTNHTIMEHNKNIKLSRKQNKLEAKTPHMCRKITHTYTQQAHMHPHRHRFIYPYD